MTIYGKRQDTGEECFCPFSGGQGDQCGSWCPMFREVTSMNKRTMASELIGYECVMAQKGKGSALMGSVEVGGDEGQGA